MHCVSFVGSACESVMHVVRDCSKTMQLWESRVFIIITTQLFHVELEDGLILNLNST